MARAEFSPAAEADLDEIWLYIARDNPMAADEAIDEILRIAHLLAESPRMGRARPDLVGQPGLRSFPADRYRIYYRPVAHGVDVSRVLHMSRDEAAALGS